MMVLDLVEALDHLRSSPIVLELVRGRQPLLLTLVLVLVLVMVMVTVVLGPPRVVVLVRLALQVDLVKVVLVTLLLLGFLLMGFLLGILLGLLLVTLVLVTLLHLGILLVTLDLVMGPLVHLLSFLVARAPPVTVPFRYMKAP